MDKVKCISHLYSLRCSFYQGSLPRCPPCSVPLSHFCLKSDETWSRLVLRWPLHFSPKWCRRPGIDKNTDSFIFGLVIKWKAPSVVWIPSRIMSSYLSYFFPTHIMIEMINLNDKSQFLNIHSSRIYYLLENTFDEHMTWFRVLKQQNGMKLSKRD